MPIGPGPLSATAEQLLADYGGTLAIVVLVGGADGPSFDVAASRPHLLALVPDLLRALADGVQADLDANARKPRH
jgi:hypothetical protein